MKKYIFILICAFLSAVPALTLDILLMGGTENELNELREYFELDEKGGKGIDTLNSMPVPYENPTYCTNFDNDESLQVVPDGKYDVIYYSFVPGMEAAGSVKSLRRILKPNGMVIFFGAKGDVFEEALCLQGFKKIDSSEIDKTLAPRRSFEQISEFSLNAGLIMNPSTNTSLIFLFDTDERTGHDIAQAINSDGALKPLMKRNLYNSEHRMESIMDKCDQVPVEERPDLIKKEMDKLRKDMSCVIL